MRRRRGFTIVELFAVIAVIVVLISILLPALGKAREQARKAVCMSNLKQLTEAWLGYAADNDRQLLVNGRFGDWVMANSNRGAIISGKLYPYLHDDRVYRCPQEEGDRLRSYSINDYLNGDWPGIPSHARRLSDVRNGAATFAFIEEFDPRTYNVGGFTMMPYPSNFWIDHPAVFHGKGSGLSFVDGHCEFWTWKDAKTWTFNLNYDPVEADDSPDLRKLQAALGTDAPPAP
jgi:prepilin-type processing-associated H-X9-DG protein